MADFWAKTKSILAGNLNSSLRYLITSVPFFRNKRYTRSIRNWTGQSIGEDSRYGLSAPQRWDDWIYQNFKKEVWTNSQKIFFAKKSGGLRYMDLKTGSILQPILENASEGVCTIHADFTGVGNLLQNDFLRLYSIIRTVCSLEIVLRGGPTEFNL